MKSFITRTRIVVALSTAIFGLNSLSADTTIDTTASWSGGTNSGWYGSGQSITVPTWDTFFKDLTVYADSAAAGQTFTFTIFDALNGGTTLFTGGGMLMSAGANTVTINQAFAADSVIFAQFDYNGYSGSSLQYNYVNSYGGGNSSFGAVGSQLSYPALDHKFIANFSAANVDQHSVPDSGATFGLLGLGLIGVVGLRRRLAR
jgi:hypothetical protein